MLVGFGGRRRRGWQSMRWLMPSPSQWIWVWVNSRSWWWTGRPGVLRLMGLQRVRHDWATELNWTEWSSAFPYFLQFKSEFDNREFIIWAIVSSQSCLCWLYRASPYLAAKNIINLISVLTIWWCPRVFGRRCLLWPVCSLGKSLLAFALFHSLLQGQICLLLQVSLDFLLLHSL